MQKGLTAPFVFLVCLFSINYDDLVGVYAQKKLAK